MSKKTHEISTTFGEEHLPDTWHVPPVCQGQHVEVAYGIGVENLAFRRTTDKSDGSVQYEVASAGRDDWQPWNEEPTGYEWRTIDVSPAPTFLDEGDES